MLKQSIKAVIIKFIEGIIGFRPTLPLFNFIFENSSPGFRSFVIRNVRRPPVNYLWKTKLLNNKTFNIYIDDNFRSWQFVYNYRWFNIGEAKAIQLLNDYYPIEDAFIDVGANLGLMTIYSAAIKRRGILFEPNASLNDFTRKQYAYNDYTDYVIENYCLSDKPGNATFYVSGSSFQSSLNKDMAQSDRYGGLVGELKVELITLDDYLSSRPDIQPSIIKIDAEGHDFEVLKGAENTIRKFQPSMLVEVSSHERHDIINFVTSLGFKCFGVSSNGNDFLIRPEREKEFNACMDVLFVANLGLLKTIESFIK